MLRTLLEREQWQADEAVIDLICAKVGWLAPFYLALLLNESISAAKDRRYENPGAPQTLLEEDITDGYERLLAGKSRFHHWYARLQRDLVDPLLSITLAALAALARADEKGLSRRQLASRLSKREPDPDRLDRLLDAVLYKLADEGYVVQDERICFRSFLLRDYWKRNHA